jgi:hypothetical protein
MKLKNKEVLPILLEILQFKKVDEGSNVETGLLTEELTLGTRRRLQRIREELLEKNKEIEKDALEISKLESEEERNKEFTDLADEEFTLKSEPVSLELLENVKTKENYDMILLEKITK